MKVFVTDGAQNHALAVARSLGAKGVEVVVGESSVLSKGGFPAIAGSVGSIPPRRRVSAVSSPGWSRR
ncbi:MAG: hypothetical protein MPW17_20085 [Candidatus Manganitrophus sp.]|nr:hypothetical protein [Candidatus Manganitrophus sp.]WDT71016.1 MAG: hypothetical protein MPW17_20085 [Candidatus Manganitrophus sp.]